MLMRMTSNLYFYKLDSDVKDPVRATEGSACFDLHASLPEYSVVKVYLSNYEDPEKRNRKVVDGRVQVNPNERPLFVDIIFLVVSFSFCLSTCNIHYFPSSLKQI